MSDTTSSNTLVPAKKTTEEKIRIAIAFLQRHGYQVISAHKGFNKSHQSYNITRQIQHEKAKQLSAIQTAATLNSTEVAALMGVHVNTLLNWIKAEKFPSPLNLPGHFRWNAETIKQYMDDHGLSSSSSIQKS